MYLFLTTKSDINTKYRPMERLLPNCGRTIDFSLIYSSSVVLWNFIEAQMTLNSFFQSIEHPQFVFDILVRLHSAQQAPIWTASLLPEACTLSC